MSYKSGYQYLLRLGKYPRKRHSKKKVYALKKVALQKRYRKKIKATQNREVRPRIANKDKAVHVRDYNHDYNHDYYLKVTKSKRAASKVPRKTGTVARETVKRGFV